MKQIHNSSNEIVTFDKKFLLFSDAVM